jgi:hypothetical protein
MEHRTAFLIRRKKCSDGSPCSTSRWSGIIKRIVLRVTRIRLAMCMRWEDVGKLSKPPCEDKSRAHPRISLNSLKCPISERLVGGGSWIRTVGRLPGRSVRHAKASSDHQAWITVPLVRIPAGSVDFRVNLCHLLDQLRQAVAAPSPASHPPCRYPVAHGSRRGVAARLPSGWNELHRRVLY